ncbi:MAG: glycosyltransferase family 9 protein [Planctomycetaceae bacterium]|nr:glycosyltransferase family 9 protein [Planctomycetaceae bacterium]
MPLDRLTPRRIALIKPSALGDIAHSLPVLTALRVRFPAARITWVVNTAYEPLIRNHPDLTDTLPFDRGMFRRGVWNSARYAAGFAAELRSRQFDLVIDLQGLFRTGLMCLATGAPHRIGFANAREGSRHSYTRKISVPDADRIHAVDRYWRIVEALGAGDVPKRFHLPLDPGEVASVRAELAELPRPWIAVAVGAKWLTKRWPTTHFTELLSRAQSRFGGTALFVGAGDDTAMSQEVIAALGEPRGSSPWSVEPTGMNPVAHTMSRDFTGRTSLPRLAALLSVSDAMLGNDTGPLHLAAALGRPCVAPYTCTKVALHGPYTSMSGGVETSVPCGGSYIKTCDKMICMPELTPDRLWPTFAEVLDTWQRKHLHSQAS